MGWISLALRKQALKSQINELNYEDIQLSRKKRAVHRKLSAEQASYNADKRAELKDIKEVYLKVRGARPDPKSEEYQDWYYEYQCAQEDYQSQKQDIEEYYDDLNEEAETEAQDEEDAIDDEVTRVEAQRDAMNAELQALTDSIKTQIEASAIKF